MSAPIARLLAEDERSRRGRRLLDAELRWGAHWLRGAALASTLATVATLGQALGLAMVISSLAHGRSADEAGSLVLIVAATLLRAGSLAAATLMAGTGALRIEQHVRGQLLARLLDAGPLVEAQTRRGATISGALDQVEQLAPYFARYYPARLVCLLAPVAVLAAVLPASWVVGVLLVVATPLIPVNLAVVGLAAGAASRRQVDQVRRLAAHFLDRLQGLETLRALGADERELDGVRAASRELASRTMAVLRVAFLSSAVVELIITFAIAVVATYVGLTLLGYLHFDWLPRHLSLERGLFALLAVPIYFQPLRVLAGAYHERGNAAAAADALAPLLQGEDAPLARPASRPIATGARGRAVVLEHVTVRFPGCERPALEEVTLTVDAGQTLAVTGVTGAGKSTLLAAVCGQVGLTAGRVELAGVAVERGDPPRELVTWLTQRPYLFAGTLLDNLLLARPSATRSEISRAVSRAGLAEVVGRLSDGLDTRLGERGRGLAGGEAQRLAMARALLRDSPVLLLDEPTAHLDAAAEASLVASIAELARGRTVLIASHSPALVNLADRIVCLERGRLAECDGSAQTAMRALELVDA